MKSLVPFFALLLLGGTATAQEKQRGKVQYHVSWTDQHGMQKCHNGASKEQTEKNAAQMRGKKGFSNVSVGEGKCDRGGHPSAPASQEKPQPVQSAGKPVPATTPVDRQPVGKEPAEQKPVTSKPTVKEPGEQTAPVLSKPTGKEPAEQKPVTSKPAVKEPDAQPAPVLSKPTGKEPAASDVVTPGSTKSTTMASDDAHSEDKPAVKKKAKKKKTKK